MIFCCSLCRRRKPKSKSSGNTAATNADANNLNSPVPMKSGLDVDPESFAPEFEYFHSRSAYQAKESLLDQSHFPVDYMACRVSKWRCRNIELDLHALRLVLGLDKGGTKYRTVPSSSLS